MDEQIKQVADEQTKQLSRIADALEKFANVVIEERITSKKLSDRFVAQQEEDRARMKADQEEQRERTAKIDREREEDRARMRKIDEERGREPRSPHPDIPSHAHQFPINFCAGVRFCAACGAEDREAG